jgi:2-haloacid dehalogenase
MGFDTDAVETLAFDSYGTIVDVTEAENALAEYVDNPNLVAKLWRNRSLGYATVGNAIEEYEPFYGMIRHALKYALDTQGVEVTDDEREEILSVYHELNAFDDVRDGMERLRDAGYDLYIVSNGNQEMLESMIEHVDIGDLIEDAISAEEVEAFKPAAEVYRHAAEEIGTPAENVAFVAAGWWDVPGAMHAGMQGVWVNRQDTIRGPYDAEPDLTIESFHDLADELEA